VKFPGEDGGRSLAEMAQRDLDAALQLLADRAQYITGASGAAIAIRRDGRNDMLCRASTGSNAPELGALLSTEFGLSGESVRTRQLLRCDDAERDARVNREVCRQLGIASVVVMPVVNDDQVLGVFELFSGKANAFGERDVSAIQRLSEMVETAVKLAHAAEHLPEQLKERLAAPVEPAASEVHEGEFLTDLVIEEVTATPAVAAVSDTVPGGATREVTEKPAQPEVLKPVASAPVEAAPVAPASSPQALQSLPVQNAPTPAIEPTQVEPPALQKKTLFWSAAVDSDAEVGKHADADQSHVPPVLRGLRKCMACGFPVSAGRELCVECEEKKWRGQLRTSSRTSSANAIASARLSSPAEPAKAAAHAFAAAAPTMAKAVEPPAPPAPSAQSAKIEAVAPLSTAEPKAAGETRKELIQPGRESHASTVAGEATAAPTEVVSPPELVLSAGMAPSQSWLSRNKYVFGVLLVIASVAAAAAFFLR